MEKLFFLLKQGEAILNQKSTYPMKMLSVYSVWWAPRFTRFAVSAMR